MTIRRAADLCVNATGAAVVVAIAAMWIAAALGCALALVGAACAMMLRDAARGPVRTRAVARRPAALGV